MRHKATKQENWNMRAACTLLIVIGVGLLAACVVVLAVGGVLAKYIA